MMHISCTICTDVVEPDENLHATRCGHVFHNHCLSDWIERSNTCPQCRRVVTDSCMLRIYPTFSDEKDITSLQSRLHHALDLYKELQTVCVEKDECLKKTSEDLRKNEETLETYMSELDNRNSAVEVLKQRLETLETQQVNMQSLQNENALLKVNVKTLNREIQRQNILYDEFRTQITLQQNSLDSYAKVTARLREENEALKKMLKAVNGELKRYKLLNDELRSQVSLQKDQKSDVNVQSTKQIKDVDTDLTKNEGSTKILDCVIRTDAKKREPWKNLTQDLDTTCITEKMGALSQKLDLAKSSHKKLSTTLVKLIVEWLKYKNMNNVDKQNSLFICTSQNESEVKLMSRLSTNMYVDQLILLGIQKDSNKNQPDKSPDLRMSISHSEQNKNTELKEEEVTKSLDKEDLKRMTEFFTKRTPNKMKPENICKKENANITSVILSTPNINLTNSKEDNFQNAIRKVLITDTLRNYEKNFKSFNIGDLKKNTQQFKNNTGRKYVKPKRREGFEFDDTKTYGVQIGHNKSLFKFEARGLPKPPPPPPRPMPPLPAELKKSAITLEGFIKEKFKDNSQNKKRQPAPTQWSPLCHIGSRVTRRAKRRAPLLPVLTFPSHARR